jgi:hypothetical protein
MADEPSPISLPLGWMYPDPDWADSLHAELLRELPPGHLLFGRRGKLIATRGGTDDVLFQHSDEPGRFTVVHLTWLGRQEIDAQHPWVEFDGDFAGFVAWEEQFLTEPSSDA